MNRRLLPLLVTLGAIVPSLVHAEHFDFIYADQITLRAPLASWGITLAGSDFALLVNKSATTIDYGDLAAAEFRVDGVPVWPDTTTPMPDPVLWGGINPSHFDQAGVPPIAPNEAAGSIGPLSGALPSLIQPGETLRNTFPSQFLYLGLMGTGTSPGLHRLDVHIKIGEESAYVPIDLTLIDDDQYDMQFTHVTRVSSVPLVTSATSTTWGRVKKLYR